MEENIDHNQIISLRPQFLSDFIGNKSIKTNLSIFINGAKIRNDSLDHVLIFGPPGLGKTTLSQIIANEMNSSIKVTSGPIISKPGDLAAILSNIKKNDVIFIDEIHRLNHIVKEMLYSAMEDFAIDFIVGEGPGARSIRISLPNFTLIGATTRPGLLSNPFRDRFGIQLQIEFYKEEELSIIISKYSDKIKANINNKAALMLARSARGTPRIALRLLRRVRDFASDHKTIDENVVILALNMMRIDSLGLDNTDYRYIHYIHFYHDNGPVGIETITAGLSEDRGNIEESIEPYLLQIGFLRRTNRGRIITENAINWLIESKLFYNFVDKNL
ncbi:Holliday junction branch migration DNA helicase RuvB [Lyticum sinuosum]|uniref:Holliday junction branch migration complex subunit RuvB n=1 Tax=Lyticum sinuosum TaxID=1332059 RepID=A0AAE4VJ69_9RICK|nr:Holliday junction branch migration DNA helicase RuvB [Lyticum sinuosum]MDZ5761005.1 Holliday junction ATP-dependent DNA helicase RuvB [Lyticum sinuosum]